MTTPVDETPAGHPDPANNGTADNSGLRPIKDLPDALTVDQDLRWLAGMRDKLALYLSTLERNAENVTKWLAANRTDIIVRLHQWNRTLDAGDEDVALALYKKTPAGVMSFLLDMRDADLRARAQKIFGGNSKLSLKLQSHPAGIPADVIDALPDLDSNDSTPVVAAPTPAANTGKQKKSGVLSNWFKGKAERDAEEVARHYENMLDQWRTTRLDLVNLQSDRHYYVDSLMDWIGENLAPSAEAQDADALLRGFENPAYMINLALADYNHALLGKSAAIAIEAGNYSLLAGLFDRQEIDKFISVFPVLFPAVDTPDSRDLRQMLLKDNAVVSFAELALCRVASPADRLTLFKTALTYEKKLALTDKKQAAERLEFVLDCATTRDEAPLSIDAFVLALRSEAENDRDAAFEILDNLNVIPRLCQRFAAQPAQLATALRTIYGSFGSQIANKGDAIDQFIALQKIDSDKNAQGLLDLINACKAKGCGERLVSLWHQAGQQHEETLLKLLATLPVQKRISGLVTAHRAGILTNLRAGQDAKKMAAVCDLLRSTLQEHTQVPPRALAEILHIAFEGAKKEGAAITAYTEALCSKNGLIAIVARSGLDEPSVDMITALLSPLRDDIARAAALEKVAAQAGDALKEPLRDISKSFVGSFIQMPDGSLVCNTNHIANIWFAPDLDDSIHYTSDNGHSIELAKGVSQEFANDLLSLIQARSGMLPETNGLFNPAFASRLEYKEDGVDIVWNSYHGPLNIDEQMTRRMQSLDGFIHAKDVARSDQPVQGSSIRAASVMAIIPYAPQQDVKTATDWLVIDQQGATFICSDIEMPDDLGGLIKFGDGWVNPACADIIMLDDAKKTAELCQQTRAFEDTLRSLASIESMADNVSENFFLNLSATSTAQWNALKDSLKRDDKIVTPGGAFSHLHFNFGQLVRLTPYEDDGDSGFYCSKRGREMNSGRIRLAPALRDDLIEAFSKAAISDKLLLTENHILLKDAVVDLFYTGANGTLTLMTEHDVMDIKIPAREAMDIINDYAVKPGYLPVDAPSGLRDIIRFDRVTRLYHDSKEEASFATIGSREVLLGADSDYLSKWFSSLVDWDIEDNAAYPQAKAKMLGLTGNMPELPKVINHASAGTQQRLLGATATANAVKKAFTDKFFPG